MAMKKHPLSGLGKTVSLIFTAVLLLSLFSCSAFAAAEESAAVTEVFTMSTSYPGITAKAGDTLTFKLDFTNPGAVTAVDLSVSAMPDGWTGYFEGNSAEVSRLYLKNGSTDNAVVFSLTIPEDTAEGQYTVKLSAAGEGRNNRSDLELLLNVNEEDLGSSAFTTQYNSQEGTADTDFSFSSTLQNNTPNEQSYSFSASAPQGWAVAFKASSTQVAAVTVDARSSQSVTIEVTPPAFAEAGEYTIPVSAVSATETLNQELTVVITGSYDVSLETPSGRLSFDANANKKSSVTLKVTNNGNTDLTNLNLTSSVPTGWTVEFSSATIELLESGASQEVTAYVTPAEDALSGDYSATLKIKNSEASDSAEFRVTVKTETTWGVVGVLIILAAAAAMLWIFRKYGRR